MRLRTLLVVGVTAGTLAGCLPGSSDACTDAAADLADHGGIIVTSPASGHRVHSGFTVTGCSRTFESNVPWRLVARDGTELESGFTTGGGVDGWETFSFSVDYSIDEQQVGHLEVSEEDASDGEGFPPVRNIVPLVLQP